MSVRVGKINRHEDVHGISGVGNHLADVFEASDGTCIVRWLGKDGSTNMYAGVKNVDNVHGHGGKTEIEWLWEQEADADPMDALFNKKTKVIDEEAEAAANALAEEIVEEAEDTVNRVSEKIAEKLTEKVAKKLVEN